MRRLKQQQNPTTLEAWGFLSSVDTGAVDVGMVSSTYTQCSTYTQSSNTTKCYSPKKFANKCETEVALALEELQFSKEGTPGAIWWLKQV